MIKVKTKKRRKKENYEEYCKITLAYSNIHGKKFLNALKVILEDIRSRNFTSASSEDYKKLNKKVWRVNPVYGKNPSGTIRKAINMFSKLGFVNPSLDGYHEDAPTYVNAPTDEFRNILFSTIVHENSKFSTSYNEHNNPKKNINYIPFITRTLMRIGELNRKQIIGLLKVDPNKYPEGYIDIEELNDLSNGKDVKRFVKDKYNQIRFFGQILGKLENFSYSPTPDKLLGFKSDQKKKYKKEFRSKKIAREHKLDTIAYKKVDLENSRVTGFRNMCMVQNIVYPTIIQSYFF